jgi:hypothetical protein
MTEKGIERLAKLRLELEEAAGNGKPLTAVKVSAGWLLVDVADILNLTKDEREQVLGPTLVKQAG